MRAMLQDGEDVGKVESRRAPSARVGCRVLARLCHFPPRTFTSLKLMSSSIQWGYDSQSFLDPKGSFPS